MSSDRIRLSGREAAAIRRNLRDRNLGHVVKPGWDFQIGLFEGVTVPSAATFVKVAIGIKRDIAVAARMSESVVGGRTVMTYHGVYLPH